MLIFYKPYRTSVNNLLNIIQEREVTAIAIFSASHAKDGTGPEITTQSCHLCDGNPYKRVNVFRMKNPDVTFLLCKVCFADHEDTIKGVMIRLSCRIRDLTSEEEVESLKRHVDESITVSGIWRDEAKKGEK